MKDPIKRLARPSLFHLIFGPIIRAWGDWRHWRQEKRDNERWWRVGYFVFTTTFKPSGYVHTHVIECAVNGYGHRALKFLSVDMDDSLRKHPYYAVAQAWLSGDDRMEHLIVDNPFFATPTRR